MQITARFARICLSSCRQLTTARCLLALSTFAAAFSFPRFSLAQETVALVGSGSSVPAPLYTKWAEEYNKRSPKIQMRYLALGTSEGINQISHGNGDFAAGEVPLTAKERSEGHLIEIPSVVIGIVPIYNLPGIQGELRFSGAVLADIFLGRVKTWNSPALAKINPRLSLPDLPIKVIYRPPGKGSNYVFSNFLSKTSPAFRDEIGTSPSPKWPVGSPAERSADMVEKVRSDPGSIGYVEVQYAIKLNIPYGSVLNAAGHFVKASDATLTAACQAVEAPGWNKLSASLANAPGAQSFPITSFSWLYLRTVLSDSHRGPALADLLNWMFTNGQQIADHEGYSELPPQLLAKVRTKIDSLK
jgi:phosphate transport system substrate-binding protein